MNKYLYDAATNAFYPLSMRADYEAAGVWPEKGVEIDEETFASFQTPPEGKMRVPDKDGNPSWGDIPPLTGEDLIRFEDARKQTLIDEANSYINGQQWPSKLALGRLKDADKAKFILWLDYLDALAEVDTSTAPDITWPSKPE